MRLPLQQQPLEDMSMAIVIAKPIQASHSHEQSMIIYNENINSNDLTSTADPEVLSIMQNQDVNSEEIHTFLNAKDHQNSGNGSDSTASEKDYLSDHTYEARESESPISLSPIQALSPISTRQQRKQKNQAKNSEVSTSKKEKQGQVPPKGPSRSKNKKSLS
ncbi:hypothetical protein IFM89_021831 [Coptis chinensis]|uniref:Uncharacterized protein n=1 Tax=Coptis chinensis TaxID=261450 RepID=A0A835LWM3_9MAGN|nr:hypothetical protein IFM89_021831 [Coptis chinensis]